MRLSKILIPTQRETPHGVISLGEQLATRAGLLRRVSAGVYTILPLGMRVMNNINQIIRTNLHKIDAQEIRLPILQPSEWWDNERGSGRSVLFANDMISVSLGNQKFFLNPTSEELIVQIVKKCGNISYQGLPILLYDIGMRFRLGRGAHGLYRSQEFPLNEIFGFASSAIELELLLSKLTDTCRKILSECGITYLLGSETFNIETTHVSRNFYTVCQTSSDAGIALCPDCGNIMGTSTKKNGKSTANLFLVVCAVPIVLTNVSSASDRLAT